MTRLVKIVKEGKEPPILVVIHYPNGEERRVVPDKDAFLLVTPLEACAGGDEKDLSELLCYAQEVVTRAIHTLRREVPGEN